MVSPKKPAGARGRGRPATVSASEVAAVGLRLFVRDGYEATTMSDVALAAGIGRNTLFTHFPSKADIVWYRFQPQLEGVRHYLDTAPTEVPTIEGIVQAALTGLDMSHELIPVMRAEVTLIRDNPALQAHAYLQGAPWREVIAQFIGRREGIDAHSALATSIAHGFWEAMFVAHRRWLEVGDDNPETHMERALRQFAGALREDFASHLR